MAEPEYDVVIIGAGPAGLMAAIAVASRGLSVVVLEKMGRVCNKLRITGKGRCNLCNNCDTDTFIQNIRSGGRFLYSSYAGMDSAAVMAFFEGEGLALKTERGARVYPKSDSAHDVANTLLGAAERAGCTILQESARELMLCGDRVCGVITRTKGTLRCRAVVIATGGLSYPGTGSTGDGYRLAAQAGHSIVATWPSLVPLVCAGGDCAAMQGLSLRNVVLTAKKGGRTLYHELGEMLFTHFGISGPLVLSLSAKLVGEEPAEIVVEIDLKPGLDDSALDRRIVRDFADNANRDFKNSLGALLPAKMIPVVLKRSGISPDKKVHSVTAQERAQLVAVIKHFSVDVVDRRPIDEAVVTAGGVSLREIDPRTMMSKLVRNLHFAGEVLDADGYTGGFNLGIAFAMGHAAGSFILEEEYT